MIDPSLLKLAQLRYREFLLQAEQDRLADQLPRRPSYARRRLAAVCYRLADWLAPEQPDRYAPTCGSGPADWVVGRVSF